MDARRKELMSEFRTEINRLHANICSGLADPTRILILYTLHDRPHNVSELAEGLDLPQPTVSRHLKVLRERQMVIAERSGQVVNYSLTDSRIIEAMDLLRAVLASRLQNQGELAESVNQDLSK